MDSNHSCAKAIKVVSEEHSSRSLEQTNSAHGSNPNLFSNIINVLNAVQVSSIGVNPGRFSCIQNNVNPILSEREIVEILNILLENELVVCEEEMRCYFLTDQGRRVIAIGI